MSLLTYDYNPTATVSLLVQAMQAGEQRKARESQLIAGMAKAVADDRRHALEWDRLTSFNEAKYAEETRRWNEDNAPFFAPPVAPATAATLGSAGSPLTGTMEPELPDNSTDLPSLDATEGVDLYALGSGRPSRALIDAGEPVTDDYTGILATKRAAQLQQGLGALSQQYAPPQLLSGGGMDLAQVPEVDPLKPATDFMNTPSLDAASALTPIGAPPRADGLPAGAGEPAAGPSSLIPENTVNPQETPSQAVRRYMGDFASLNTPGRPPVVRSKDVRAAMPAILRSAVSADLRARTRTSTGAAPESLEEVTAGMAFVPEHGTYKRGDGAEYFVDRSATGKIALKAFRPTQVKASRWVQGSDGNAYALGSDGRPMQTVPDGVDLQFSPSKPSTFRDSTGNTYLMQPNGERELIIPAEVKPTAKENADYTKALADKRAGDAELAAKQAANEKKWWGVGKKDLEETETKIRGAQSTIEAMQERYPKLRQVKPAPQIPPTEQPPADAQVNPAPKLNDADRAKSLANAKEAASKKPEILPQIRQRLLDAGFTEQELQAEGL